MLVRKGKQLKMVLHETMGMEVAHCVCSAVQHKSNPQSFLIDDFLFLGKKTLR